MRIVAVAHAYPRWDGDVAGAFIERLCVALHERNHAVTVVVPSDEGNGGTRFRNHVEIKAVRYAPATLETLAYRGNMAEAARSAVGALSATSLVAAQAGATLGIVRHRDADLIHAHWWVPGGISAYLASVTSHRPFVITLHGTDVAILRSSKAARRLGRVILRRAAAVTAVSRYLAEQAASICGIAESEIVVQPMPLDVDRYTRQSRGGGGVVTVGRLVQQKNISVVLEAIALLKQRGRAVSLTVVGDGPERRSLEHRAKQLGIAEFARFVGAVPPEAVPALISDADVFAFPAMNEGLGLAAVEALMLGVPVIAARQGGGVRDFVPSDGAGRLVDGSSVDQMAEAFEQMIGNSEARRLALLEGEKLKRQLNPEAVAQLFETVYLRALNRG